MTGLQEKIKTEALTLSAVTTSENNRYYLLRTETAINRAITLIAIYRTNGIKATFDLASADPKNIQYKKNK